jgi:hypothetical protein
LASFLLQLLGGSVERRTSWQINVEATTIQPDDQKTVNAVRHYAAGFETKATACKSDVLDVIVVLDATIVDNDQDKQQAVTAFNDSIV